MPEPVTIVASCFALGAAAGALLRRAQAPLVTGSVFQRISVVPTAPPLEDVSALLADVGARGTPAVVMEPRSGFSTPARFAEASAPDEVVLSLMGDRAPRVPLPPGTQVVVQFNHGGRARMFMAGLRELQWDQPPQRRLRLAVPAHVPYGEARGAFRIALSGLQPVAVTVQLGAGTAAGTALDLSATGVGVAFPAGADPLLVVGDAVLVRIEARGASVERSATVRRVLQQGYGLSFDAEVQPDAVVQLGRLLQLLIEEAA